MFDKKLRLIVKKAIRDYRYCIYRGDFNIDIAWHSEDKDDVRMNHEVIADCSVNRRYLTATINIYPPMAKTWLREKNESWVRGIIAHEVAHLATEHVKDLMYSSFKDEGETKDAWEILTTTIGNLMREIRP